jgi:glycosyltransferase involved in cell wall biosynthesis
MTNEVCCVFPFWSQSDAMNWDSNYAYLRRILPGLSERLPGWLWLMTWPQRSKGADVWRFSDDGLFNERIVRFPWPYDTAMRSSVQAWDVDRFKLLDAQGITVYWMHQVESALQVKYGYAGSFNLNAHPATVAQQHYIIHKSLPYPFESQLPRLWTQMGGTIASDRVVFNSKHCYRMAEESFGLFLNEHAWEAIAAKSQVLPFGLVDEVMFDMVIPTPGIEQVPVVIYNHRFENYKQPQLTADALNEMRRRGHKFEVWVTQYVGQEIKSFPVDKVVGDPDQSVYLRNIAVPGLNVINSLHETFCISMQDSIALGQLPVAPRAVTFPELVPDDYPWLFKDEREQLDMLDHILTTWPEEWVKWSPKLRAFAREVFGVEGYMDRYADILQTEALKPRKAKAKEKNRVKIERALDKLPHGDYPVTELSGKFRAQIGLQSQAMPNRRVVRELVDRGAALVYRNNAVHLRWSGKSKGESP